MIKYFIFTLFQYFIFNNECGYSYANPLYGPYVRDAQPQEFPFIVSIGIIYEEQIHACTGSLITKRHVITVAHCVTTEYPEDLVVRVGAVNLREARMYHVEAYVTYEEWAKIHQAVSYSSTDLAILKLEQNVRGPNIKPAAYAKKSHTDDFIGKQVETAGWGSTDDNEYNEVMRTAFLTVINKTSCASNVLAYANEVVSELDEVFCTSTDPHVTLGSGDSGGPLLLNDLIIGINESAWPNRTHGQDQSTVQNYHIAISFFTPFIEDALRGSIKYGKTNSDFL